MFEKKYGLDRLLELFKIIKFSSGTDAVLMIAWYCQ